MSDGRRESQHQGACTTQGGPDGSGAPAGGTAISRVPLRGLARVVPPSLVAPSPTRPGDSVSDAAPIGSRTPRRFFDEAERLALVVDHLRAALIRHDLEHPIVWSIDCGAGEGLFSLAIAAGEELGPLASRLRLVGSDPDAAAIEVARAAVYGASSLRGVPLPVVQRHFERIGGGHFAVAPNHRHRAEFPAAGGEQMAGALPPRSVLAVLLGDARRESSEFDRIGTHRVIAERLAADGLLVQPPTASPPDPSWFRRSATSCPGLYVRRGPPAPSTPPVPSREKPISVRPDAAGAAGAGRPPRVENRKRLSDAAELGDRGHIEAALGLATEALRVEPNDPLGYLVRAQLQLAGGSVEGALDDLRRLLFLAPDCRLARYWYVLVLRAARMPERARVQLDHLEQQLAHVPDEELLEDDVATVGDLRTVIGGLRARLCEPVFRNQGEST